MKTSRIPLLVGIVLLAALAFIGVASACEYGCTPGYWKNHPKAWPVEFVPAHPVDLNNDGLDDTAMDMLRYKGGSGIEGAQRILLRAYVASYLNRGVWSDFPNEDAVVIEAIHSGDRAFMLNVASDLDGFNNGVCPF